MKKKVSQKILLHSCFFFIPNLSVKFFFLRCFPSHLSSFFSYTLYPLYRNTNLRFVCEYKSLVQIPDIICAHTLHFSGSHFSPFRSMFSIWMDVMGVSILARNDVTKMQIKIFVFFFSFVYYVKIYRMCNDLEREKLVIKGILGIYIR